MRSGKKNTCESEDQGMARETPIPPEQMLANAIIIQAADDYRISLRRLKINRMNREYLRMKEDCESFFLSEWFEQLTNVDGKSIMMRIQKEEL